MALLLLLALSGCTSPTPAPPGPPEVERPQARDDAPDILIISVDTLRADRLSTWGYARDTSPNLDTLAASAIRFDRAVAPAPWTLPSVTSLFTGLMPTEHGVVSRDWQLPDARETLAERALAAGYETAFFGVNAAFVTGHGLSQGFETWRPHSGLSGRQLNREVLDFLASRADPRPLFLVVHYFEPHCRYNPPRDVADRYLPRAHAPVPLTRERYDAMGDCFKLQREDGTPELDLAIYRARYDAEVREVDRLIGELWGAVSHREPWLGVLADHGEAFWEHGAHGHGSQLYDEQIRVPMLVRPPGGTEARVEAHAISTLWLTAAADAVLAGRPAPDYPALAFSETDYGGAHLRAVVREHDKIIRDRSSGAALRFALQSDAGERSPVSDAGAFGVLEAALETHLAGVEAGTAEPRERGAEEARQLEALGYQE